MITLFQNNKWEAFVKSTKIGKTPLKWPWRFRKIFPYISILGETQNFGNFSGVCRKAYGHFQEYFITFFLTNNIQASLKAKWKH